jgi:hypothetical protein
MKSRRLVVPLAAYGVAAVLALAGTIWFGAFYAGFNEPDEPSHFLNALFVRDYFRDGFGTHPMKFATDYYFHYPKLAIGHWPPAYYGLIGLLFFLVPATSKTALILNTLISVSPVLVIAAVINRFYGALPALLASVWYVSLPVVIWSMQYFLLDQAVTATVLAACASWLWFASKPTMVRAMSVAFLSSLAVLTKGNGWLVALFPLCHMAFTARWDLLKEVRTYLSLIVGLLLVVPWYVLTVGISADGFNYSPGFAYAQLALVSNLRFLVQNLGYGGVVLAIVGAGSAFAARSVQKEQWQCAAACLALVVATLIFQSIVPASLEERYVAPAMPGMMILAIMGFYACVARIAQFGAKPFQFAMIGLLVAAAVYPALLSVTQAHAKGNLRLDLAADKAVSDHRPEIWIIDGAPSAEGAFAAEVAIRDRERHIYVVRSSQLLAVSDFMGRKYRLKFADSAAVLKEVEALGIQGIVLVDQSNQPPFDHSRQLRAALSLPQSGYKQSFAVEQLNVPGKTELYESTVPRTPDLKRLREINFPAKAQGLGAVSQAQ